MRSPSPGPRSSRWTGRVLELEKPHVFAFLWGEEVLRLELAPGGRRHPAHAHAPDLQRGRGGARNAAGWHVCLDRLGGEETDWDPSLPRSTCGAGSRPGRRSRPSAKSCHGGVADLPRSFQPRGNPSSRDDVRPGGVDPAGRRRARIVGHGARLGWPLLLGGLATSAAASRPRMLHGRRPGTGPGLERPHELDCHRPGARSSRAGPAHGRLTGFAFDATRRPRSWATTRADDNAPAEDSLGLRLKGPGGTTPSG